MLFHRIVVCVSCVLGSVHPSLLMGASKQVTQALVSIGQAALHWSDAITTKRLGANLAAALNKCAESPTCTDVMRVLQPLVMEATCDEDEQRAVRAVGLVGWLTKAFAVRHVVNASAPLMSHLLHCLTDKRSLVSEVRETKRCCPPIYFW